MQAAFPITTAIFLVWRHGKKFGAGSEVRRYQSRLDQGDSWPPTSFRTCVLSPHTGHLSSFLSARLCFLLSATILAS